MEIGELLRAGGCLTPGLRDFLCLPRSHDGEAGGPTYQDSVRFFLADHEHVESLTNQGILPCPAFWCDARSVEEGRAHLNITYHFGSGPVQVQTLPFSPIKIQPVRDRAPAGPRRIVCRAFLPERMHLALYRIELCLFPRLESIHKALMGPEAAQLITNEVPQGLELSLAAKPTETLLLSVNLRLACLELRSPMHILQSDGRLGPAPPCLRSVSSLEEAISMLMAGNQRLMRPGPSRTPDRSTAKESEFVEPAGIGYRKAQTPPMQPASSPGGRTDTVPTSHNLDSSTRMAVSGTISLGSAPSPAKPPLPAARGGGLLHHALRLLRSDPTSAARSRDACALLGRCLPDGATRAVGAGALEALATACRHSAEATEEQAVLLASTTLALLQAKDDEPTRQQVVLAFLSQLADTAVVPATSMATEDSSTSGSRSFGFRNGDKTEQLRSQTMLLNVLDRLLRTRPGLQPVAVSAGALCLLESIYLSAETDNDLVVQAMELQGIAFQENENDIMEEKPILSKQQNGTITVAASTALASRRSPGRFAPSPLQLPDFLSDGESSYAGSPTKSLYAGSLPPSPPPRGGGGTRGRQDLVVPRLQLPGTSGASSPSRVPSTSGLLSPMACAGDPGALELGMSRKQTAASFSLGSGGRAVGGLTRSTRRRRAARSGDRSNGTTTQLSPDGHAEADCLSAHRSPPVSATETPAYQLERLGKAVAEGVAASCLPSVTALRRMLLSEYSSAALPIGDDHSATVDFARKGQPDVHGPSGVADIGAAQSHACQHINTEAPLVAHRICVQDSSQGSDTVSRRSEHGAASSMSVCTVQSICLELWSSLMPLAPNSRPLWDGTKLFEAVLTLKILREPCSDVTTKSASGLESRKQRDPSSSSYETAALKLLSGRALATAVLSGYSGRHQIKLNMISARSPGALRALADSLTTCSDKALSTKSDSVLLLVRDVIYAALAPVSTVNLGSWSEEHWETYAAAMSAWIAAVDASRSRRMSMPNDAQRGLLALAFEDLGLPPDASSPSSNNNVIKRSFFPRSSTALDLVQAAVSQLLSMTGVSTPSSARAALDKEQNAESSSVSSPGVKLKQTLALLTTLAHAASEISPLRRRDATRPGSDIVLRGQTRRGVLRALGFLLGPEYGLASSLLCTLASSDEQDTMLFPGPSSKLMPVTVSLQQAAFDCVTALFGAVGSPHALHRPTTDFYVRHHFVQFLRLYHNPGRDPRAVAQCRRHLSVLLALARGAGPGVRSRFHQLSALEFFARELSLETKTTLHPEPSRELSATTPGQTLLKRKDSYQVVGGQDCTTATNVFSVPRLLFGDAAVKQTPGSLSSSQRRSGSGDHNGGILSGNNVRSTSVLPRTSSLRSNRPSTRIAAMTSATRPPSSLPAKIPDGLIYSLDGENRTLSSEKESPVRGQSDLQLTGDLEEDLELLERLEEEGEERRRLSALEEEDEDGVLRATPARKIGLALPPSSARSDETSDSADLSPTIPAHHVGGRRTPALLSSLTGGVPALNLGPAQKRNSPPKDTKKFAARIVPVTFQSTGPNCENIRGSSNRLNARLGPSLLPRLALPASRSTLADREAAARACDQAESFDDDEDDANGTSDESSSSSSLSGGARAEDDDVRDQNNLHGSKTIPAVSFSELPGQRHRRRKSNLGFQSAQGPSAEDCQYDSPSYRTERARRLLYDSTELHLQILELVFCQVIGMPRTEGLDRSTTDPFPLLRGLPNVPFILQRHLSHPSNAALVPELASRLSNSPFLGEPALRLLRLVSGEFFRPEWYADRERRPGSNGAYATIYCCRLPPFLCPPKEYMTGTTSLQLSTISSCNKNEDSNSLVVLKMLDSPSAMQDRCSFVDVYGEVGTMCALSSSPRFAHLLDYGFDPGEGTHTLVMPQYTCSLKQWRLRQGTAQGETTTWRYLCIFQEILRAVKDLGDKGIAHFDLKCDNVLIQRRQGVSEREFWNPGTSTPGSVVVTPSSGSLSRQRSHNSSGQRKLPFDIVLADFGESVRFSEENPPACGGRSISARDNAAGPWGSCSSLSGAVSPLSHETGSAWAGSSTQDSGKSDHHRNQIDARFGSAEYNHDEDDGMIDDSEHLPGINEHSGEHLNMGRTCRVRGTDAFKSPEMLLLGGTGPSTGVDRRRPKGVGPASDVWSLGCLLYELLTGELLVKDTDWASLVARVASGRLPLFTPDRVQLLQGHPFTLDLIQWILVRDPERRPSLDDIDKRLSGIMVRLGGISSSRDTVLSSRQSARHDARSISAATSGHPRATLDPKEGPTLFDAQPIVRPPSRAGLWKKRKPQPLARGLTPVMPGLGMCPLATTPSIMRRHAFFCEPVDRRVIILLRTPSRRATGSSSSSSPCKGGLPCCWQTSSPLSSVCGARKGDTQYAVSPEPSPIKAGHQATAVSVNPLFANLTIASPTQGVADMDERSLNSGGTPVLLGNKKERKKPRSLWAMLTGADVRSAVQIADNGAEEKDRNVDMVTKSPASRQPPTSSLQQVAVPRFSSVGLSATRTDCPEEESVACVLESQDEDAIVAAHTATALGVPWKAVYCPINLEQQQSGDGHLGRKSESSIPILRAWLKNALDHQDRKQESTPLSTGRDDLSAGALLVSLQSGTSAAAVLLVLATLRRKGLSMLETMTTASHWGLDTHIEPWLLDVLPELLNLE